MRLLSLILGLGVMGWLAYVTLTRRVPDGAGGSATPTQTLVNVRAKANQMEREDAERAEKNLKVGIDADSK